MPTYAAITPPATVAMPPTMTHMSSDSVMSSMYGRTSNGASVWPTKMFAEADSVSAPEVLQVTNMILAKNITSFCMTPR